jgi:predicted transglutaminase-like cysteine proteinase
VLRRLFGLACACALVHPAQARPCRGGACGWLSGISLAHVRHDFDALAHAAADLPLPERIAFVNVAINRLVAYADDAATRGADTWLTPLETLAFGRGDCEDIAIAKFFLLLASGAHPADVRLLYARLRDSAAPGRAAAHVVALARHPYADPFVLDNLHAAVVPVSSRPDLDPIFSFDRSQLWAGTCGASQGRAPARLRLWRDVLARMTEQLPAAAARRTGAGSGQERLERGPRRKDVIPQQRAGRLVLPCLDQANQRAVFRL